MPDSLADMLRFYNARRARNDRGEDDRDRLIDALRVQITYLEGELYDGPREVAPSGTTDVKMETRSLLEWLDGWGDGPNWSDASGATVPVVKASLRRVLESVLHEHGIPGCAHCNGTGAMLALRPRVGGEVGEQDRKRERAPARWR